MIRVVVFDPDGALRAGGEELLAAPRAEGAAIWIDLQGLEKRHEVLFREWGFHPLAIEDAFTLHHQPRVEEYADELFIIVRGIDFNVDDPERELRTLKLAAFLSNRRLVTAHRAPLRSVNVVHDRLVSSHRAVPGGHVHVLWSIFDELMDFYFPLVDAIGEKIEGLEVEVVEHPQRTQLERVLELRRKLATLRRNMMPHRQVFGHLANSRFGAIDATAALHFRDTQDNVLRLVDAIEQQRDLLANVKDTYLSVVAQRTNDVMRVLTVFSAIVLPLSLLAGIYGMNFENMPELHTRWGYFVLLGGMAALAGGLIAWFRKKRWL